MKTNTARYLDALYSSRRLCVSWLATLLLATSGTATAATFFVDVGSSALVFTPDSVTIQPGDTVKWTWGGSHGHSVTSGSNGTSDGLFDAGTHTAPFTFSFTFPNAGTFEYFCRPHVNFGMFGFVRVVGSTAPGTLGNISTRLAVQTGDNVLIGGFIVTGTQPKRVIVRALGPSLSVGGVPIPGRLGDTTLELKGPSGTIALNDNWRTTQEAEIIASTVPPPNDLESAIVATLPANTTAYTAIVRGAGNTSGVGSVEVYDLDRTVDSQLANISTRGLVQTGDNVMIGGLIVVGPGSRRVIVRAIGPSLNVNGVPLAGRLLDTTLEIANQNGSTLAMNDDWRSTQEAEIIATTVPPPDNLESAIVATLPAAPYTAIVRGKNSTTGIALVEAFALSN